MLSLDARALVSLAGRAPELLRGDTEIDERADVWGLGVLLYTMLAGAPPFTAADSPSRLNLSAVLDEPAMLAGVPEGLAELVDSCIATDRAARPQTMTTLAARLALYRTQPAYPVFEKRGSLLVVETTGKYEALVLERLVRESEPPFQAVAPVEPSTPAPTRASIEE